MDEIIIKNDLEKLFNGDVRLVKASFSHVDNILKAQIVCGDNYKGTEIKKEFIRIVNAYLQEDINYDITVNKSLSPKELINAITKALGKYQTGNVSLFENCYITKEDENNFVNLCVIKDVEQSSLDNIRNQVRTIIKENCLIDYKINFVDKSQDNAVINLEQREQEVLSALPEEEDSEDLIYQVEIEHVIYGTRISNFAIKIKGIHSPQNAVSIAGKVEFFRENTYKSKDNSEEEKIRYNFALNDGTGKIDAVFFPPKKLLEKGEFKLNNGQEIIVLADVVEYNQTISIKVREIAQCVLPILEENHEQNDEQDEVVDYITDVNENYNLVFPQQFEELEQIGIFSMMQQVPQCLMGQDYVVFDLETTGLEPSACDIIEIGAVKIRDGKIIQSFTTLVKPKESIPQNITDLTGIDDDMVVFAPKFEEVVADFYKFTRDSILVAHNATFDISFLRYHAQKCRYNFDNEYKDTYMMARSLVKGVKNYKLKTLTEYFNIILINAHRALNDTVATAKVFIELCRL